MSAAENKAAVQRYFVEETWQQGSLAALDQFYASGFNRSGAADTLPNAETVKQIVAAFQHAFSEFKFAVVHLVAEGEIVMLHFTFSGRHTGDFNGIAASEQEVSVAGVDIFQFEQGKVVAAWTVFDNLSLLRQLGVLPPA